MDENEKYLIKNTTKEQRIALIKEWMPPSDGFEDEGIDLMWDMYDPYIRGEKELRECNSSFASGFYEEADARIELQCALGNSTRR